MAATPPRRRLPRAQRKAQILDVATRAFGDRGYDAVSMDALGDHAGVTKPVLYRHFGSKEGLFLACSVRMWTEMGLAIYTAASAPGPSEVRLWRGIVAYFDFLDHHRYAWRILYPQASRGEERFADQLREVQDGAIAMMTQLFASAPVDESLASALAEMAEPMAWAFVGAATAIAIRWMRHPDEPKDLQAERLMSFAWMGFGRLLADERWEPPTG